MTPCLNCGRTDVTFPLGRPRRSGVRVPFRYCHECIRLPSRIGGGVVARRRARSSSRRRLLAGRTAVLGPAVCRGCRSFVWWRPVGWWEDADGRAHQCAVRAA